MSLKKASGSAKCDISFFCYTSHFEQIADAWALLLSYFKNNFLRKVSIDL